MHVLVLFAQRMEKYKGEYGPECLAVMSEWDAESNPNYLRDEKAKADATGDFERTEILTLKVSLDTVMSRLRPGAASIFALVL